jgi:probable phosphomutase (TIGR03848 family)
MTRLILIRHGHNDWADKKLAGWTPDVHLNEHGRQQAQALVERLAPIKIDAIYSSPLDRTLETAQPLAKARGLKVVKSPGLGEVRYGDWQGKSLKILARKKEWRIVQVRPSAFRFPNGESLREMQNRAVAAVEEIAAAHPKGTVALFSHGDVIKAVVAFYSGIALDNFQRIGISPASISVIDLGPFGARLGRLNDTGPFQAN